MYIIHISLTEAIYFVKLERDLLKFSLIYFYEPQCEAIYEISVIYFADERRLTENGCPTSSRISV